MYQAEGNLQESAKLLLRVTAETNSDPAVRVKLAQFRLERNQAEAIRFLPPREARLHFASPMDKGVKQVGLALIQRVAGDTASAKGFAEEARNTLEPIRKEQPNSAFVAAALALAYAMAQFFDFVQRGNLGLEVLLQSSFRVGGDLALRQVKTKCGQRYYDNHYRGEQPSSKACYTFVSRLDR